jgi:hypothetical protein
MTRIYSVTRLLVTALAALPVAVHAQNIRVTVENLAPNQGTFLTPVWVGFHNGTFDLYDSGAPAAPFLERIAEDGSLAPLRTAFAASGAGTVDGAIFGGSIPPVRPGETASALFTVVPNAPSSRYFSYASMIIPSNDAFIANGNPMQFEIFDANGRFLGADFLVTGDRVLDAGTEVNDEIPAHTAFFGQATPNTGTDENGVVHTHPGFNPVGSGGILDSPQFANANFKAAGYNVARIRVTAVPEPGTVALLVVGSITLGSLALRRNLRCKR